MTKKPLLPDVNLWIALTFRNHRKHAPANAWFTGLSFDDTLFFCRTTQQGFLRLSTNAKVLGNDAVSLTDAWKLYDSICSDSRVHFAIEPAGLESQWRNYSQGSTFSTNIWTDAYLASFAMAAGYEVVTFDNGFTRYAGLSLTLLK